MKLIALDPGRATGWAMSDRRTGVYLPPGADDGEALARWWGWLGDMLAEHKPDCLVIERAFMSRQRDADWTPALIRSAHAIAHLYGVKRAEYAALTVRKTVLGRATKWTDKERVDAAQGLGFALVSNHAADAALLLRCHEMIAGK